MRFHEIVILNKCAFILKLMIGSDNYATEKNIK